MRKQDRLIIIGLIMLSGCSTMGITSSWKAKDAIPQSFDKIMVLGLIRDSDRSLQEKMENHLVDDLKDLGYNAVSSLDEYGPRAFEQLDEHAALGKLRKSGIDAVITIVLLNKQKEKRHFTGDIYYSPYHYSSFWVYRSSLYQRINDPGYYVTDTRYFWESNLYQMDVQKLLYSVQTQSFDPAGSESQGHAYGRLVVKDMVKNNVLQLSKDTAINAL